MLKNVIVPLALLLTTGCGLLQSNKSFKQLENQKQGPDTSFIYRLPFATNKKVFLVQGYASAFSHKGNLALDFKVKTGTPIHAARGGIVTAARKDNNRHGLKPENLSDGNYLFILHADGSTAQYWHFKLNGVLPAIGDTILQGQLIGYSGHTGYSAFPHLHFEVSGYTNTGSYANQPTRFITRQGIRYLRPGRFYRVP
jgi:murein DD-endopeptidase MepM/ murein hydrolase activator NlpD